MPKLPHISGKQCIKALEKLGFQVVRQKGSHLILKKGATGCVVPLHKELKIGTLSGILKQAGVEIDQFLNQL